MSWVQMHPFITNWPGGGPPPIFDISTDENGSAVVELAWDPQALTSPSLYSQPLRYYSSDQSFTGQVHGITGGTKTITVPAQHIDVVSNQAQWIMPAELWDGFAGEHLTSLSGAGAVTGFHGSLYYRVRFTPTGGATTVWPADTSIAAMGQGAPHISMLPISGSPSSQVLPDDAAVGAIPGPLGVAQAWSAMVRAVWRDLPETDPDRRSLARVFAHPTYLDLPTQTRASVLKLWLLAGPSRQKLPALLDRQVVVGSNLTQPAITKTDLRGGRTLIDNLLVLLSVTPHPDLVAATTHEHLVDDVLTEILDPNGQVNQGAAGTCAPTTVQTLLITVNPSEYARLMTGWLSVSGTATLANGDTVSLPPGVLRLPLYVTPQSSSGGVMFPLFIRTYSELAFQAAGLSYAQGAAFPAVTGTPANVVKVMKSVIAGGLTLAQGQRLLAGLFGVTFTVRSGAGAAVRDRLAQDLPLMQQPIMIYMSWGAPPNQGGHAVLAMRIDGGRLFFKNPQYAGSAPPSYAIKGGNNVNPPRRYEDPQQSLESMTMSDLASWIWGYLLPDHALL